MKISSTRVIAPLCLVAMFVAGFLSRSFLDLSARASTTAASVQGPGSRKCSLKTLKGAYGIKFEGQRLGTGPLVSISRIVFDGEGTFTTTEIGRFNGNPLQRTFTGPYTINDDCTGFLDFSSDLSNPPHEAHGNFVIVDEGREFFVVDNEEFWAASGIGKKI
ncbi:MAG TPA: hypothetical protein VLA93_12880 [Pyrinomonadaceae bacterium]|nr:hypothetical protein [Pyrinomonadaceae bacterium]